MKIWDKFKYDAKEGWPVAVIFIGSLIVVWALIGLGHLTCHVSSSCRQDYESTAIGGF